MTAPKRHDWLKWLTTEECVYLCWLTAKPWPYKDRLRVQRRIQVMRTKACQRRKRNDRRFAIYQRAMP